MVSNLSPLSEPFSIIEDFPNFFLNIFWLLKLFLNIKTSVETSPHNQTSSANSEFFYVQKMQPLTHNQHPQTSLSSPLKPTDFTSASLLHLTQSHTISSAHHPKISPNSQCSARPLHFEKNPRKSTNPEHTENPWSPYPHTPCTFAPLMTSTPHPSHRNGESTPSPYCLFHRHRIYFLHFRDLVLSFLMMMLDQGEIRAPFHFAVKIRASADWDEMRWDEMGKDMSWSVVKGVMAGCMGVRWGTEDE